MSWRFISKIITYHISQFTKTALATFESDTESCFDRIVMPLALVCFMIWGAPLAEILIWDSTLQHIWHHVKKGYGITEEFYEYSKQSPIIGPGQGSKAGSPTCSTLIFLLLKAMDIFAKGLLFASPNQLINYSTKAIVFADDNTNINNNFPNWIHQPPTANRVLNRIQHNSQTWKRWLHTSGGKLKLIKCKYYMLLWQFNDKRKANHTSSIDLPTMHLTSGSDSTHHSMSQLDCSIAHNTLGAKTAPSLQTKTGFKTLDKNRNTQIAY